MPNGNGPVTRFRYSTLLPGPPGDPGPPGSSGSNGAIRTVSGAFTILPGDYTLVVDTSMGAASTALPNASAYANRSFRFINKSGSHLVTIGRTGGQKINNRAEDWTLTADGEAAEFHCDGTAWWVF